MFNNNNNMPKTYFATCHFDSSLRVCVFVFTYIDQTEKQKYVHVYRGVREEGATEK